VLAVTGSTALQAVEDHGRVEPGDQVLVLGASGGVGTYAVQIAKALGGIVTGVASSDKLDLVRRLGASRIIDYRTDDPLAEPGRYDVIIDTGGNHRLRDLRRALTPTGTLVIVGGENGGRWIGGSDRQIRAKLTSLVTRQRLATFVAREDATHLERLADLVETGHVTPVVDRSYPLTESADAITHLESGRNRGKIAIAIDTTEER
jgi:NADPH:quinone reductase-like Zn-dependent oxidoreductase